VKAILMLISLAVTQLASASTLVMPTPSQVNVLACSSPSIEYQLSGESVSGGPIGILFEQTKCTQHTIKGGYITSFHHSCSYVVWNTNGSISLIEVMSSTISKGPGSLLVCISEEVDRPST